MTPGGLTGGGNYAITFVDGTLTVNPAPLTVTATTPPAPTAPPTRTSPPATTASCSARTSSDLDGELSFATPATRRSDVGSYRVTPDGLTSGNYAISYDRGTLTVDPAPLTVTANDASRTYGAANPDFTARFDGFVLGEDAGDLDGALAFDTAATRRSDVGGYASPPAG